MATKPTCHECAYSYLEPGRWLMGVGFGWPSRPVCANHPESIGQMRPTPASEVCCNYRARPATPEGQVKQIPLDGGAYAYVDAADHEWLSQWAWHLHGGYAARNEKGKRVYMHRQIMEPPPGMVVDHTNGNKADNTRANLNVCTQQENLVNRSKRNGASSRFRGVNYNKDSGKWRARITFEGGRLYLGEFAEEVEAARAYDRKAAELFGELARLNFPEEWPAERRQESKRDHVLITPTGEASGMKKAPERGHRVVD
ncbi:MAG: HNH endonuclease [Sedimentisphaerales bacterium]|nr:HNH endonuclease [Sedimentisphaerales bacterium]